MFDVEQKILLYNKKYNDDIFNNIKKIINVLLLKKDSIIKFKSKNNLDAINFFNNDVFNSVDYIFFSELYDKYEDSECVNKKISIYYAITTNDVVKGNIYIAVYIGKNFFKKINLINEYNFEEYIYSLLSILAHEIVHMHQILNNDINNKINFEEINYNNKKKIKEYLSRKHEKYAFAIQSIYEVLSTNIDLDKFKKHILETLDNVENKKYKYNEYNIITNSEIFYAYVLYFSNIRNKKSLIDFLLIMLNYIINYKNKILL